MNCDELHLHLDAFLEGTLERERADALYEHLRACSECRSVVSVLQEPAPASFALDVVARTTGSACGRVRGALADAVDDAIDADPVLLAELRAHLHDCAACDEFSRALDWSLARLPRLAEAAVDADFTADVLMATLERPSLWKVFGVRVHERVERWLERPLVAQEMAFAFTVLLVLLTATPWSPLPGLPQRALDLLQIVPEVQAGETRPEPENWSLVQALPPLRYVAAASEELREDLDEVIAPRVDRLARDLEWVEAGLGETGRGVVAGEGAVMREGLRTLGCGWSSLWVGLRVPSAPVAEDCAATQPQAREATGGEGDTR